MKKIIFLAVVCAMQASVYQLFSKPSPLHDDDEATTPAVNPPSHQAPHQEPSLASNDDLTALKKKVEQLEAVRDDQNAAIQKIAKYVADLGASQTKRIDMIEARLDAWEKITSKTSASGTTTATTTKRPTAPRKD